MDTRLLISRERKERKINNWHQFLIWVENRMDESHTDHLDFSFLLSQHWTENQTGYGIIQLKIEWTLRHCQFKNKQQTLNYTKYAFSMIVKKLKIELAEPCTDRNQTNKFWKSKKKKNEQILDIKKPFEKSNGQILEIRKPFEKSNRQILGIKKSFEKSKGQILEIKKKKKLWRNQTDKFWKSKNHSRNQTDKFWNEQDKNQNI